MAYPSLRALPHERRREREAGADRDVWQGLAWSPDGQKFAFVGGRDADVYVINADGSGERRLTRKAGNHFFPAWSPDGQKIAFGRGDGPHSEQIYIMNADGSGQQS